jgi:thiol-disulfide isomerase/thioredoxin
MACQPSDSGKRTSHSIQVLDEQHLQNLVSEAPQPYVLINFYATYCKPCIKEIPELLELRNDPNREVEIVLVSLDDEEATHAALENKLNAFLQEQGVDFPTYHFPLEKARQYIKSVYPGWNTSIPLNLIFTNTGRLIEQTGITDKEEVEMIISQDKSFFQP